MTVGGAHDGRARTGAGGSVGPAGEAAPFEQRLKDRALALGFDLAGIARLGPAETSPAFEQWLAQGFHGEMDYLRRGAELRQDTRRPEPGMVSAVVVTLDYGGRSPDGPVARYARGDDYHRLMWDRLDALLAWVRGERGAAVRGRAYVDTGPVLERDLARRAGLGWFGKNTMLIHPQRGSFFFIGALFLELDLAPDAPFAAEHCGTCTRCLDACPTQAFTAPGVLDARRCISYLTIESRSPIPDALAPAVGAHLYGCDVCQDVCPWNRRAPVSADSAWQPRPALASGDVVSLFESPDAALRAAIKGSAMSRAGVVGLRRSLALATAASRSSAAREALVRVALGVRPDDSPSFDDEIVIEHIAWGLQRASRDELSGTESPRQ